MTGPRVRAIAASLAIATLAVACTGSDQPEVQPPLESAEPLTSLPPTTEPPATTVTESTVAPESTTTTVADTTTTSTTTEPAPSTTSLEDLRAEIEADLDEGERAFVEAANDPASEAARLAAEMTLSGPALQGALEVLAQAAADGVRFRLREEPTSSYTVLEAPTILSASEANVLTCRIDSAIGYTVDADGNESIVADTIIRTIAQTTVVLEQEVWKIRSGERVSRDEDVTTCD